MKHLVPLIIKEFKQIKQDPSSILLAFILPILMIMLFGTCINLDSSVTKLALVTEDEAPPAHNLTERLVGSPNFDLLRCTNKQTAMDWLHCGKVQGVLLIPNDFSSAFASDKDLKLMIVTDGTVPNTAQFTSMNLQHIAREWLAKQGSSAGIAVVPLYRFNKAAISRNYILPGSISVVLSFVGTLLTTMVVAREWERGTMEGILASSVGRMEFILSKLIPYFVLGLGAMAVCTASATLIFDVPLNSSLLIVFGIASIFLLSVLSIGLLISTVIKAQYMSSLIAMNTSILPTMLLSGFVFELSSMPNWVQAISYLIPARYFSNSLTSMFLSGPTGNILLVDTLFLLVSAIFWLGLVFIVTPKRLDS